MVRLVALSFAGAIFGCGASQNALEQKMSQWVQGQIGTHVGNGQCTALLVGAEDAARDAGFTVPQMTRDCYSDTTIYCWSDTEISYEDMQAGDFVQFKDWYEYAYGYYLSASHHSAVVRAPFDGTTLKVWEQNPGAVDEGDYHPYVGTGEIHVFRMGGGSEPSPSPSPAPSPSPPPTYYKTLTPSSNTWLCLDLPGDDATAGAALWLWECNGAESQRWVFEDYQIRFGADESKCVDAGDMSNGHQAVLWDCNGYPQQSWSYDSDASRMYLSNTATCMDFFDDWQSNGQPVHTWECSGNSNQEWSVWNTATSVSEILIV